MSEHPLDVLRDALESRHFVKGAYQCRYCWESDGHTGGCPVPESLAALRAVEQLVEACHGYRSDNFASWQAVVEALAPFDRKEQT